MKGTSAGHKLIVPGLLPLTSVCMQISFSPWREQWCYPQKNLSEFQCHTISWSKLTKHELQLSLHSWQESWVTHTSKRSFIVFAFSQHHTHFWWRSLASIHYNQFQNGPVWSHHGTHVKCCAGHSPMKGTGKMIHVLSVLLDWLSGIILLSSCD